MTGNAVNIVSAIFAMGAALLWIRSTILKAPTVDDGGFIISEDGYDVLETAMLQTRWSRHAAKAAALAAFFQAIAAMSAAFPF